MAEFIRYCRQDLKTLGADLDWQSTHWPGIGTFTKRGTFRGRAKKLVDPTSWLAKDFIEFAKSYIRYVYSQNPAQSEAGHGHRLRALRVLEEALLSVKSDADPAAIDTTVLDKAASLARAHANGQTASHIGNDLELIASLLNRLDLIPATVSLWRSGIRNPRDMGNVIGSAGDAARSAKLPDLDAIKAIASVFASDLNPGDERHHRDIYTTTVTALLLGAPSRAGDEIHHLPVDLIFEATDKFDELQTGLRYEAGKGFGSYVKWIWDGMAPAVQIAIERLRTATEEARNLARWMEDPATKNKFYRHLNCPNVADDALLTTQQVVQALGFASTESFQRTGLRRKKFTYTLDQLWNEWILSKAPAHFPYVSEKRTLKYSEALFCMRRNQLHGGSNTSPVLLWMPSLKSTYRLEVGISSGRASNFFDRHELTGADGSSLVMKSHQLRHLLNTEGQRGKMTDEQLAWWSGRADMRQNRVYNHMTEAERVDRARPLTHHADGSYAVVTLDGGPPNLEGGTSPVYWDVRLKPQPASCADLDLSPRGARHVTLYGYCEHDFLFAPCENFGDCLQCHEHSCVKGAGKDDQERLARIRDILIQVTLEAEAAKRAVEAGDLGAPLWHAQQSRYESALRELVSILESKSVAEGSFIRLSGETSNSHLHRVLRSAAMNALSSNTVPERVVREMLDLIKVESADHPSFVVEPPPPNLRILAARS